MFVCKKKLRKPDTFSVQVVESQRIDGKVRQIVLIYIGYAIGSKELEEMINLGEHVKKLLKDKTKISIITEYVKKCVSQIKEPLIRLGSLSEIHRKIIGIHDIYIPILKSLCLDKLLCVE